MGLICVDLPPNNELVSDDDGEKKLYGDVGGQPQTSKNIDEENAAKERLVAQKMRNQFDVVVDQGSEHKMTELLSKTPLATVKGGPQSGNFLCHLDCNHYGEATTNPSIRKVPMGKEAFKKLFKPVMTARRYGEAKPDDASDVPEHLAVGDIFTMLDANKDRKRLFTTALKVKQTTGKQKSRMKRYVCYTTESSQCDRKKKSRSLQCTQGLWRVMNASTEIPNMQYKTLAGSNKSDMFGPVELEKTNELRTLPDKKAKTAWWGSHRIIDVGGKLSDSEPEDSESGGEEPVPAPAEEANTGSSAAIDSKLPICYHQSPPIILEELVWSNNVKHVLDLAPSPSTAGAARLIGEYGASYCCVASTETSATWFRNNIHDDLMKMCSQEGTKLHAQCQLWAGMVDDKTRATAAPGKRKLPATGGGGIGGAGGGEPPPPGAPAPRRKRTPKNQTIDETATESQGGNGTGGGTLDIGALLAAAKTKARAAGKGTAAGEDDGAGGEDD